MTRKTYQKLAIKSFKYAPVITAFIMLIHLIGLLFGICTGFAETICGLSIVPLIITYLLSKGLGFCKMHRMFIDYTFKMFLCIQWEQWVGFGTILLYARYLMLLMGIGIFIYFLFNIKQFIINCDSNVNINEVN